MNRSPLRRRPQRDPVTPELRLAVLERDRTCVLWSLDPKHVCTDRWGFPQNPDEDLSLEHVKDQPRMGRRAPSDMSHLVAMCYGANVSVPSKAQREKLRRYLVQVNGGTPR